MDLSQFKKHSSEAAALMRQLANSNRLMIVCSLIDQEMSVGELNDAVPLSQSALSQHLAGLREAKLVSTRRDGQTIFYRLNGDNARQVVAVLKSIFCPDDE